MTFQSDHADSCYCRK